MSLPGKAARTARVVQALMPVFAIALSLSASSVSAKSTPSPTVVRHITYHGWTDALLLTNGRVDVVFVPSIGRVMAFQFAGRPETNALWSDPALRGKPYPASVPYPSDLKDWPNYGGDKLWTSPQDDWPKHQPSGTNWPPDPQMDAGPYQVTVYKNGLRLTGPVSRDWATQPVRDFVLLPGTDTLTLRETFRKAPDAPTDKQGYAMGLWNIAQVNPQTVVYLPLNPHSRFPNSIYTFDFPPNSPDWHVEDGLLTVTAAPGIGNRVAVDATEGWMAALYAGDILFSTRYALHPGTPYPDANTTMQVWNNGDPPYLEMEAKGPLVTMAAGDTQTRTLVWNLRRLPRVPHTPAEARILVKKMMRQQK